MAAAPVSTVFLTAGALRLTGAQSAALLSAVLVLSGAGSLLQSLGVWKFGARLPFVMLLGGAATALFLQTAKDHGPAVASGSVLLAAALLLAVVPLYARIVRLFPPLVMGVTVLLIGIAMVRVAAQLIAGPAGTPAPRAVVLAGLTVAVTLAAYLLLRGVWRQSAVLIGMVAATVIAAVTGLGTFSPAGAAASPSPTSSLTGHRGSTSWRPCPCSSSASPPSPRSPARPSSTARRSDARPIRAATSRRSPGPTR